MKDRFTYTEDANCHPSRAREMIKKYPQIKELFGPYPLTGLIAAVLFTFQMAVATYFGKTETSWWIVALTSYVVGAIIHHAFFVIIHEAAHNLIFKSTWANKVAGIFCDICQMVPASISFRYYHIIHHTNMGEYDLDADLSHVKEADLVGNSFIKKCLWYLLFLLVEALRPFRLRRQVPIDGWLIASFITIIVTNIAIYNFMGIQAWGYLMLSTVFSVGLHPVGARWIQEHYVYREGQQTYSYYGPLNKVSLNVGFHNEHHDFFNIPWIRLPKLKAMAPEYYKSLYAHHSWSGLLWNFLTNKDITLYSRILKEGKGPKEHGADLSQSKGEFAKA